MIAISLCAGVRSEFQRTYFPSAAVFSANSGECNKIPYGPETLPPRNSATLSYVVLFSSGTSSLLSMFKSLVIISPYNLLITFGIVMFI